MTEIDLQNRLVQNLKLIRKNQHLTQETLAEKAGLSSQIINDIEGGRRWPRRMTLSKIITALDIDIQDLFCNTNILNQNYLSTTPPELVQELKISFDNILKKYESR